MGDQRSSKPAEISSRMLPMGRDHWLRDAQGFWVERFREMPGQSHLPAWAVDRGQLISGQSPLLKSRRRLSIDSARELWQQRLLEGWQRCEPQW